MATATATTRRAYPDTAARRMAIFTRSWELAEQAGLGAWDCRFRSIEIGIDDCPTRLEVDVASATDAGLLHRVDVDLTRGVASCDCIAAAGFGRPCRHAGVAFMYGTLAIEAYASAAEEYAAQLRAEDRADALAPSL